MHVLIVGMTESGKTTLAKILASKLHAAKHKVVVYDPVYDPDWKCTERFRDVSKFDEYLQANREVFAFVDEGGEVFADGNDTTYSWWATRSRHYGHSFVFLAQRTIQIPKTMRDQCSRLHLFTSSVSDGKILAEEWNNPELIRCNQLPRMQFYSVSRYQSCELLQIRNFKDVSRVNRGDRSNARKSDRASLPSRSSREMDTNEG